MASSGELTEAAAWRAVSPRSYVTATDPVDVSPTHTPTRLRNRSASRREPRTDLPATDIASPSHAGIERVWFPLHRGQFHVGLWAAASAPLSTGVLAVR